VDLLTKFSVEIKGTTNLHNIALKVRYIIKGKQQGNSFVMEHRGANGSQKEKKEGTTIYSYHKSQSFKSQTLLD